MYVVTSMKKYSSMTSPCVSKNDDCINSLLIRRVNVVAATNLASPKSSKKFSRIVKRISSNPIELTGLCRRWCSLLIHVLLNVSSCHGLSNERSNNPRRISFNFVSIQNLIPLLSLSLYSTMNDYCILRIGNFLHIAIYLNRILNLMFPLALKLFPLTKNGHSVHGSCPDFQSNHNMSFW